MTKAFDRFCIVGLGNHAKTKLIPALLDNGQQIAGLVSSQDTSALHPAPRFPQLEDALAALPADTVFIISTPPPLHFAQASLVLRTGRDLILEKPAFVSAHEAAEAAALATHYGGVLVEAFMQRHTRLHERLLALWRAERDRITGLKIEFLIPEMPKGTFRHEAVIAASSLYDIGCYPLSLLADLELPLGALDISGVEQPGRPDAEAVALGGRLGGVEVEATIGVGPAYANRVTVTLSQGADVEFAPFFFGRAADRFITRGDEVDSFHDANAFQKMFAVPRSEWLATQPRRMASMIEVTAKLEELGKRLLKLRGRA